MGFLKNVQKILRAKCLDLYDDLQKLVALTISCQCMPNKSFILTKLLLILHKTRLPYSI